MGTGSQHIAIIGGGFCGIMTATHLLENAQPAIKITLINSGYPFAKGVAYSAYSDSHLLNIVAGKMSAYSDRPTDFVDWAHEKTQYSSVDKELLSHTFLPRKLYGEYLENIWNKANTGKKPGSELNLINDTVVDVEPGDDGVVILLKSGKQIIADKAIIATGNSEPRDPTIPNSTFYSSPAYFKNSWKAESASNIKSDKDILIIGNGLTMVDTVLGLIENGFTKTIYSISPHGFGILPHRHGGVKYTGLTSELKEPYNLHDLVRSTHKHIRQVRQLGISAEPIIDSLRPHTQKIWQALSLKERRYFMNSRLRHMWGVARHRLPVHTHDFIQNLRIQGKLVVLAGNIKNIEQTNEGILVSYYNRKTRLDENLTVERVINCTGPESSIKRTSNTLLQNMFRRGVISSDPLELGMNVDTESFKVIDKYGDKIPNIFTLGTNMRGMLWETTAVPELRVQAEKLAKQLLQ
jgi:uncharacterized NAD(P)/FAD-binding protein YdhS